jgi:tRNA-dihydrouridine synthase
MRAGATAAWQWWERVGRPRTWLAPMVGQSEPAFRMLCRAHGCDICSTEMIDGQCSRLRQSTCRAWC